MAGMTMVVTAAMRGNVDMADRAKCSTANARKPA
jgi:hypothetical protein